MDRRAVVLQKGAPPARPRVAWDYVQKCCEKPRRRVNERRNEEPWLQRPWFRTLQTCEEYLFLRNDGRTFGSPIYLDGMEGFRAPPTPRACAQLQEFTRPAV